MPFKSPCLADEWRCPSLQDIHVGTDFPSSEIRLGRAHREQQAVPPPSELLADKPLFEEMLRNLLL